ELMATHKSATYVYCLVAGRRPPSLTRRLFGLAGMGRLRLIDLGKPRPHALGKWLVVADAPLDRYSEQAINRGLSDLQWVGRAATAHEAVAGSFVNWMGVPPIKLFTFSTSDGRGVDQVRAAKKRIDALIPRVATHQKGGARFVFDPPRAANALPRTRKARPAD